MKEEKIKRLISEAMNFAPQFRKSFANNQFVSDAGLKISPHQFFCLTIIYKYGQLSMSGLAEHLGVSNQQITRIVDYLVQNNFVERFTDPQNRRLVQAKISESGKEMLFKFEEEKRFKMMQALDVLTEKDIDECIFHVQAIKAVLSKIKINSNSV